MTAERYECCPQCGDYRGAPDERCSCGLLWGPRTLGSHYLVLWPVDQIERTRSSFMRRMTRAEIGPEVDLRTDEQIRESWREFSDLGVVLTALERGKASSREKVLGVLEYRSRAWINARIGPAYQKRLSALLRGE